MKLYLEYVIESYSYLLEINLFIAFYNYYFCENLKIVITILGIFI
jgi:hypothetical protein